MSQTVADIIARAAYEVGDELYRVVKKPEMIKALDRTYREYCQQTRISTNVVGFKGDGVSNEFDLFGPVFDPLNNPLGFNFGDNFFSLYRVEFSPGGDPTKNVRAIEADFEWIMNKRMDITLLSLDSQPIHQHPHYAIKYLNKYQRIYFAFIPAVADEILLWYYEYPRIGTINDLTQTFPIDDKNTDDLIIGLTARAWKRMLAYHLELLRTSPGNDEGEKDKSMVQYCAGELKAAQEEWKKTLLERSREFAMYREEVTPTVAEVGSPFETEIDPTWETDYTGYDV